MRRMLMVSAVVALMVSGSAILNAEMLSNERYLLADYWLWVEEIGDWVCLEGSVHDLTARTENDKGWHVTLHANYAGLRAVAWSGTVYRGSGCTTITGHVRKGETFTWADHFALIGRGAAPNLRVTTIRHFTVNAQGELTSSVGTFEVVTE